MNKSEAAKILAIIRPLYPNAKVYTESMVSSWVWQLGEFDANLVLKAAQIHVSKSRYFPTPADIRENITRASIMLMPNAALDAGQKRIASRSEKTPVDMSDDDLEELCRFCGLGYENDN